MVIITIINMTIMIFMIIIRSGSAPRFSRCKPQHGAPLLLPIIIIRIVIRSGQVKYLGSADASLSTELHSSSHSASVKPNPDCQF